MYLWKSFRAANSEVTVLNHRYYHLLSPVKIGNVVLKNRMLSSNALPHYLQGSERYPADPIITYYADIARNGAAIVTCPERLPPVGDIPPEMMWEVGRMPYFDMTDPAATNYFAQLADAVHFYGTKLCISVVPLTEDNSYGAYARPPMDPDEMQNNPATRGAPMFQGMGPLKEADEGMLDETVEAVAQRIKRYQDVGFDMVSLHLSYRGSLGAQLWSPLCNHRTDKYGGSLENRARFILSLCKRIKELCGKDFLIETQVSGEEEPGGITLEDTVWLAHRLEGIADIMQLRMGDCGEGHPTGFDSVKSEYPTLRFSEAVKRSGARILAVPVGGFQDVEDCERILAEGKADMIAMARAFICDPEYGKKIIEGRGEDVIPCIRCNKCHAPQGIKNRWVSICSVNPLVGISHRANKLAIPSGKKKKVAVIGGGFAGMRAAIMAAENGHQVTLYEATGILGGQLAHSDVVAFKWPIRDLKDYLIRKLDETGVTVELHHPVTPEEITREGFDAVIAAVGATAVLPNIPGKELPIVKKPDEIYGKEDCLGQKVVVVGGSSTGVETGLHLAQKGKDVVILTRKNKPADDVDYVHYYENIEKLWNTLPNFSYYTHAETLEVLSDGVVFRQPGKDPQTLQADTVILCGGVSPKQEQAMAFFDAAPEFFIIGDCSGTGNIQQCFRTAYAAASVL